MRAQERDIGQALMIAAGFLAACLFVFVSMSANLNFGLSLATTDFDKIIYGSLSLGADLMKVALPIVAVRLWRNGCRIYAVTATALWFGTVAYSLASAIGFASATRSETVMGNQTVIDARQG
jgi:hypothetical protein